jgi:hypothetical protein
VGEIGDARGAGGIVMSDGYELYDAHTHLGAARHSGRVQRAEELLREMDRYGIATSLAIPFPVVDDYRREHDLIAAACRSYPGRFAGAACLYPYIPLGEFRDEVRRCREELGFVALKLQPQYQALNPLWESSEFLFETALEFGMTLVVHTGSGIPYSLPSMYILPAMRYPELKIVLAHCGGGGLFSGEAIVAAKLCPNVYLELSSLLPHSILEVLRHVGPERLMVGSDLPENLDVEFGKVLGLAVGEEAKRAILGGTARAVFG